MTNVVQLMCSGLLNCKVDVLHLDQHHELQELRYQAKSLSSHSYFALALFAYVVSDAAKNLVFRKLKSAGIWQNFQ